jgi:hypothetical protein
MVTISLSIADGGVAQIDRARHCREGDVLVVKPVLHAPGSDPVDDAATGLGSAIDDGASLDRVPEPVEPGCDMQRAVQRHERLPAPRLAVDHADLLSFEPALDEPLTVQPWPHVAEPDQLQLAPVFGTAICLPIVRAVGIGLGA